MTTRTQLPVWQQLQQHALQMQACHMKTLFDEDADRFNGFSIKLPQLLLDYSKNLINKDTMGLLMQLARDVDVEQWRDKMFAGERINFTEDRAVLHVALRDRS
ncbi:MAG: glucose-6-phosphate isomerase, partial [Psychrosphaera sp.]|nr:glucose-6-phosphate isomerase [Psychrosphaera sp.]